MSRSGQGYAFTGTDSTLSAREQVSFRSSMFYSVLPAAVSDRIPALSSFRRSFSSRKPARLNSVTELPRPQTPPPNYSSRPPSGSVTPTPLSGDVDSDFANDASEQPSSSASTLGSSFGVYETTTGINWKYARSGISFMTQAYRESSASLRKTDESCTNLVRQLYVHGITYFIRGLPANLTPEETFSLQAAMPLSIIEIRADSSQFAVVSLGQRAPMLNDAPQETSLLHRVTATIVFQSLIIIHLLLPYVKLLLANGYQLERKHQITKRLVNTSITTVDELGRRGLRLSQTVCQMNDGKVGQAIKDMTIWWVKSVTGGVQQGLEEGLEAMRSTSECSRSRVTLEQ